MDRALLRERLDAEKIGLEKLVKEELYSSNTKLYISQITRAITKNLELLKNLGKPALIYDCPRIKKQQKSTG